MKIYTKTGDSGTTSLFGGQRVDKNSARIKAYGEVDELNSLIGVIISGLRHSGVSVNRRIPRMTNGYDEIEKKLLRIQSELFVLGADLAAPYNVKVKIPRITKVYITRLEKEIDKSSTTLPQLKNFILPSGSAVGSKLHLARTVARRAERSIVDLTKEEKINIKALIYINRLSDWLFTQARYINKLQKITETPWRGRSH